LLIKLKKIKEMKKIFMFLALAGLIVLSSCKQEECPACPEPEIYGAGRWDAYKLVYNGEDLTNSGNPVVLCYLTDYFILNEEMNGDVWHSAEYDTDNSTCNATDFEVVSWMENWDTKFLSLTVEIVDATTGDKAYYTKEAKYVDDEGKELKMKWGTSLEIFYKKVEE